MGDPPSDNGAEKFVSTELSLRTVKSRNGVVGVSISKRMLIFAGIFSNKREIKPNATAKYVATMAKADISQDFILLQFDFNFISNKSNKLQLEKININNCIII